MHLAKIIALAVSLGVSACQTTAPKARATNTEKGKYEPPRTSMKKDAAIPGRYLGYLRLQERPEKVAFTIDLLARRSEGSKTEFSAVARQNLGGFDSGEYVAGYFRDVVFNHATADFEFGEAEGADLRITEAKLHANGLIIAKVSSSAGLIGDLMAVYAGERLKIDTAKVLKSIFATIPQVTALSGAYAGTCDGKQASLQLQTAKSTGSAFRGESPSGLAHYRIIGTYGHVDPMLCGISDKPCVRSRFSAGSYDFHKGKLKLEDDRRPFECMAAADTLTCNGCALINTRAAKDDLEAAVTQRAERDRQMPLSFTDRLGSLAGDGNSPDGEYAGYLFIEATGKYQLMRLKVATSFTSDRKNASVGGVATLFFGDPKANEFIVFRFDEAPLGKSIQYQVFDGPGSGLLQVSRWNKDALRGIWYSKTYGRVGAVELSRKSMPLPLAQSDVIGRISGGYRNGEADFNLFTMADRSETAADFFSVRVRGLLTERASLEKRTTIESGIYDYLTGVMTLAFDDGRMVQGTPEHGMKWRFTWSPPLRFGSVMNEPKAQIFSYNEDEATGLTTHKFFQLFSDGAEQPGS